MNGDADRFSERGDTLGGVDDAAPTGTVGVGSDSGVWPWKSSSGVVTAVTVDSVGGGVDSAVIRVVGVDVVVVGAVVVGEDAVVGEDVGVRGDAVGVREVGAVSLCDTVVGDGGMVGVPVFTVVGLVLGVVGSVVTIVELLCTVAGLVSAAAGVGAGGIVPFVSGVVTVSRGAGVATTPVGPGFGSIGVVSTANPGIFRCPGAI